MPTLSVFFATNEPWGAYHSAPFVNCPNVTVTHLIPDSSVDAAHARPLAGQIGASPDVLVVNGAHEWPAECVAAFPDTPVVASSLAYLNPTPGPCAQELRGRVAAATAASRVEADTFAKHFTIPRFMVQVVGNPRVDMLPAYRPEARRVGVVTSVTYSDKTGGAAPGTQLLLDSAILLRNLGWGVVVCPHPREDRAVWAGFEIADTPTLDVLSTCEVGIGIPGTTFPLAAALGVPMIGTTDVRLTVPRYLTDVCAAVVTESQDIVRAVMEAELPPRHVIEESVGPIGGALERLVSAWRAAADDDRPALAA